MKKDLHHQQSNALVESPYECSIESPYELHLCKARRQILRSLRTESCGAQTFTGSMSELNPMTETKCIRSAK